MDTAFRGCTWKTAGPGNTCGGEFAPGSFMHRDVAGATIGVLGYGAIGSAVRVQG
jgi:phosphoglycerate dehydrogenase-like enzyme